MNNYSPRWVVTGGDGQLAQALQQHPLAKNLSLIAYPRRTFNILDPVTQLSILKHLAPTGVIHTAAYTAVDQAEKEREKAQEINYQGTKNVAIVCETLQIPLIHLSTDYVFAGQQRIPYREDDPIHPLNCYGQTKAMAELAVREHCVQHIILRVSGIFSEYGHNFLKTILGLAREKSELNIVNDQFTCPTSAHDIADAIVSLASQLAHSGTYHYCSQELISWYKFACQIIKQARQYIDLAVREIKPIASADYKTLAIRPAYSGLDCAKIQKDYGIKQPSALAALDRVLLALLAKGAPSYAAL